MYILKKIFCNLKQPELNFISIQVKQKLICNDADQVLTNISTDHLFGE